MSEVQHHRTKSIDSDKRATRPRCDPSQAEGAFDFEESLARLGGDRELFDEILDIFLEDAPKLMEQASRALADGDAGTLGRSAHSLKGLSANFTAAPTVAAAYAVELHARQRNLASAAVCLANLEIQLHRLESALAEFRRGGRKS